MSATPPDLDGANDDLDRSANTRTLASSGEATVIQRHNNVLWAIGRAAAGMRAADEEQNDTTK